MSTMTLREAAEVARILQSNLGATRNSSGLDKCAKKTWDLCQRVMDAAQAQAEPVALKVVGYQTKRGALYRSDIEITDDGCVPVYRRMPTAPQPAAQAQAEPLFLLHTGSIDSSGEQDDWDTEANSWKAVVEFCRDHPGQTVGLYPFAAPLAAQAQAKPARRVFIVATGETHNGEETYTRHDDAPPPLCDAECLYTAPQPVAQPVAVPDELVRLRELERRVAARCADAVPSWAPELRELLSPKA